MQAVVREIVRHGATHVKVDGPYGGLEAPTRAAPPYVLLVAGGIGVCLAPVLQLTLGSSSNKLMMHDSAAGSCPTATASS